MAHAGLTPGEANRRHLQAQQIRYGVSSLHAVAEPHISKNFHMQRAIMQKGTKITYASAIAAIKAAQADHLRLAHIDPMHKGPMYSWTNEFTGRSIESGSDTVASVDTYARLLAAQWAGNNKMVNHLFTQSQLQIQSRETDFADINFMARDPAYQQSGRLDKVRADAQGIATGIQPILRETEYLGFQHLDASFDAPAPNLVVWEADTKAWAALSGAADEVDENGVADNAAERREARAAGVAGGAADPMAAVGGAAVPGPMHLYPRPGA